MHAGNFMALCDKERERKRHDRVPPSQYCCSHDFREAVITSRCAQGVTKKSVREDMADKTMTKVPE